MRNDITDVTPLPNALRALRSGLDDGVTVRRLTHLAAAKIEDLEQRVRELSDELARHGLPADSSSSAITPPLCRAGLQVGEIRVRARIVP
ncbi:MAG: hypothetical protein AB7S57_23170 [Acetobacteraceae bacterium]